MNKHKKLKSFQKLAPIGSEPTAYWFGQKSWSDRLQWVWSIII